ncbi:thioesterase domain-containing protein [Neorhizobium galegae]|nr:thioesterase domain-containing protein [Neorhizobium galegae]
MEARPQGPELAASLPTTTAKPVHLVLMNPGRNAKATPLFICAGMFGNVLNLRHLAMTMGADRPVYGLQARGLYGDHEPHATFEEMAADYIAEIRTVQPSGPYLLAGYSGGGITAFEMARQLQDTGEEVSQVIMLDTPMPRQPGLGLRDRISMKLQDMRRHKMRFVGAYLRDRRAYQEQQRAKFELEHQGESPEYFNNVRIEMAFRRALLRYDVRAYSGKVTLFRPKPDIFYSLGGGRYLKQNRDVLLPDNGWGGMCRNCGSRKCQETTTAWCSIRMFACSPSTCVLSLKPPVSRLRSMGLPIWRPKFKAERRPGSPRLLSR